MAYLIVLPTMTDPRGSLTVMEKVLPFNIQRVYWIDDLEANLSRGKHRHKETWQAMVCLRGKCEIIIKKHQQEEVYALNKPNEVLVLAPEDWHEMTHFAQNPILMVVASSCYDPNDYIQDPL